jgi:hypothetical protein
MKNKNRVKSVVSHADLVFENEMHELADAIAERSQVPSPLTDPFEEYVEVIRTKIHANPHIFRSRLTKGYNALLYELQENASELNG